MTQTPCQRPEANPEDWFAPVGSPRELSARMRCLNDCPLYLQCQEEALRIGVPYGTWGGLHKDARKRIWARMPGGRPTLFDDSITAMHAQLALQRAEDDAFEAEQEGLAS